MQKQTKQYLTCALLIASFTSQVKASSLNLNEILTGDIGIRDQIEKNSFRTDEIKAQRKISKAPLLPQLNATLKKDLAKSVTPSEQFSYPQTLSINFQTSLIDTKSWYQFKKSNLTLNGRIIEESFENQKALKDLALSFIDYYESKTILGITKKNLEVLQEYEEAMSQRLKLGDSTTIELDKVRSRLYGTQAELLLAIAENENKKGAFITLFGDMNNISEDLSLFTEEQITKIQSQKLNPQEPELHIIEKKIEALDAGLSSAKAAHLPSLQLMADYSQSKPDSFQNNSDESSYRVGLQINIPLLAGGETLGQTQAYVAQKEALIRDKEILKRAKDQDYNKLKTSLDQSIEAWRIQNKSYQANTRVFKAMSKELRGSIRTTFDSLNSLDDMYKSEIALTKNYTLTNKKVIEYLFGFGLLTQRDIKDFLK